MNILVNNQLAVLPEGTSFEYISENRLFSGSDDYTLTITFPLKDCAMNQAIFGHINRADVSTGQVVFDCEIRARNFHKFGCITITEINEIEVKTQFLFGRSEQNFDKSLDDIYINELNLGEPSTTNPSEMTPAEAWSGNASNRNAVALPWVSSGGHFQNLAVYDEQSRTYSWHEDTKGLSWQIYLIELTRRIANCAGYTIDLSAWAGNNNLVNLIVCNTLPYAWYVPQFARALPHWSVEEYFSKLELFLGCEFDIDHRNQHIVFSLSEDVVASKPVVELKDVVREYSTEVTTEDDSKCEYVRAKNIAYKDSEHRSWKFCSCHWFIKSWKTLQSRNQQFEHLSDLITYLKSNKVWNGAAVRNSPRDKMYYVAEYDMYFVIRAINRVRLGEDSFGRGIFDYKCILQPLNHLGPIIVDDSEETKCEEIEFVPAILDYTDEQNGRALFMEYSGYDEDSEHGSTFVGLGAYDFNWDAYNKAMDSVFHNTMPVNCLEGGEPKKAAEYYDRIYVAFWDYALIEEGKQPCPCVEDIVVRDDWSGYRNLPFTLRLKDRFCRPGSAIKDIDTKQKSTFRFISDTLPDVRSTFIIQGKRYLCAKLTATLTEKGMSQLIKGEFYPIIES